MAMVETKLRFLQMQVEGVSRQTFELSEPVLGEAPKGFDAVDVIFPVGELILTMADAEVFGIANVDEAVVADPAIGVNHGVEVDLSSDNPLESTLSGVRDDLSPDAVASLEDSEDDCFVARSSPSFTLDTLGSKIRFIELDGAADRRLSFADHRQAPTDLEEYVIHRTDADPCHSRRRTGRQILGKTAKKVPEFGLRYFRRSVVLVNSLHHRSIAPLEERYAS